MYFPGDHWVIIENDYECRAFWYEPQANRKPYLTYPNYWVLLTEIEGKWKVEKLTQNQAECLKKD